MKKWGQGSETTPGLAMNWIVKLGVMMDLTDSDPGALELKLSGARIQGMDGLRHQLGFLTIGVC
jgi:hypothetical protein